MDAIVAFHLKGLYLAFETSNWLRLLEKAVLRQRLSRLDREPEGNRYMTIDIWVSSRAHMAAS